MLIIYFFYGLSFGGLGLAAFLQFRRGGVLPLRQQLPWLSAFGIAYACSAWIDMFLLGSLSTGMDATLKILRMILQPISGLLLLRFGWGVLTRMTPLPPWTRIIPGIIIVPLAFVITYASTTFITPSPIDIPIDIWSRYLLYLPGSIMAGIGFIRQWQENQAAGLNDVGKLMLGAGLAFLFEAMVVGLIVPAAPYGPVSYYNYDRVIYDSAPVEHVANSQPFALIAWLDYDRVLQVTGVPIQFWRMLSAVAVTFFVARGLEVFDAMQRQRISSLQQERDRAHSIARHVAESWTEALVQISRRITELDDLDSILYDITTQANTLLNSDYTAIALLDDTGTQLHLRSVATQAEAIPPASPNETVVITDELITGALHATTASCSTESARLDTLPIIEPIAPGEPQAVATVPLKMDSQPVGVLWGTRYSAEPYSPTDLIGLERMADQAVIAIQHSLMAAQLQSLAVVDERSRIAREMHDGLAQILGYMNLQVQTLEALLKQDKRDAIATELAQMREAVQTAHADVRENILSLRTTLSTDAGVVSAIEGYVEGFSVQTGIDAQFINMVFEDLNLSPLTEVQMVCILQEALANVRKHARASQVTVTLNHSESAAQLVIVDNGCGFTHPTPKDRFGLHTMRERAQSVGGQVEITTDIGDGTQVICILPKINSDQYVARRPAAHAP